MPPPHCKFCLAYSQFGIALDTTIEEINPGLNKWTIAEGTLVK